jgi:hypothetical protein
MPRVLILAVLVVPVVLATATMLGVAAIERLRPDAFPDGRPFNSAEAAAMGNAAEVIRFLRSGDTAMRVYPVRPEIISSSVQYATLLEAAMWARGLEMIRLIDAEGAIVGDDTRRDLACLASDLDLPDIAEYLGAGAPLSCEAGRALARVVARTSGKEVP